MMGAAMYCVYVTLYSGNLLPPFYIGSSTVDKVREGYRGSVSSRRYGSIWKQELIRNPGLFKTKIISFHETRKEALAKERILHQALSVVESAMYINMVVAGEKFDFSGRKHAPVSIQKMKNRVMTDEHRAKIANAAKGRKQSAETVANRVAKNTGQKRTAETKAKMGAWKRSLPPQSQEANLKRSVSNAIASTGHKHSEETKAKIAVTLMGRKQSPETIAKRVASMKATSVMKAERVRAASQVQVETEELPH
jgi:NUMOD3 motif